ncbi:hypothetical protein OBBRIDRAFT_808758 [Obba rivulosa]|uniref:Uncharacterized protein n=1 Tax=Obba rivulosa TaxID=1052685 RepID=A0A8E2AK33_9APHY|nr:hypothetical protein OBBRIDRAFT_808758 [Obba rivulosa]
MKAQLWGREGGSGIYFERSLGLYLYTYCNARDPRRHLRLVSTSGSLGTAYAEVTLLNREGRPKMKDHTPNNPGGRMRVLMARSGSPQILYTSVTLGGAFERRSDCLHHTDPQAKAEAKSRISRYARLVAELEWIADSLVIRF